MFLLAIATYMDRYIRVSSYRVYHVLRISDSQAKHYFCISYLLLFRVATGI